MTTEYTSTVDTQEYRKRRERTDEGT